MARARAALLRRAAVRRLTPSKPTFDLGETLDLLGRTPGVVAALLRGSRASWHAIDEGPGTWSAFDVVGHLIHGEETDWVPRACIILEQGEARPFEPFDRFAQLTRFAGWSLDRLLDRFTELRRHNLETVRGWRLSDAQLARTGRHPEPWTGPSARRCRAWAAENEPPATPSQPMLPSGRPRGLPRPARPPRRARARLTPGPRLPGCPRRALAARRRPA
jgi:hypothetical protein